MPWLAPLSWVFQTLAVFFLVGGYSAARGYRGGYWPWLRKRMVRLARPIVALVAVWAPVTVGLVLAGVPATTMHTLLFLVTSPLWFLGVYAGLTALTPAAMWLVRRFGAGAAAFPAAVVAGANLVRFSLSGPGWVGWVNVTAGWLVPYLLTVLPWPGYGPRCWPDWTWEPCCCLPPTPIPAASCSPPTGGLSCWAGRARPARW